jgi:hypothetical protein
MGSKTYGFKYLCQGGARRVLKGAQPLKGKPLQSRIPEERPICLQQAFHIQPKSYHFF